MVDAFVGKFTVAKVENCDALLKRSVSVLS